MTVSIWRELFTHSHCTTHLVFVCRYHCSNESKSNRRDTVFTECVFNLKMPKFATFVFFDIETTGLPYEEYNQTKVTEFAFMACSRNDVMNHTTVPRVIHKLTKCVHPGKSIDPVASKISGKHNVWKPYEVTKLIWVNCVSIAGLNEGNLQNECIFSKKTAGLIKLFLEELQAPICLVAHNGNRFDYPIFRKELDAVVIFHLNSLPAKQLPY